MRTPRNFKMILIGMPKKLDIFEGFKKRNTFRPKTTRNEDNATTVLALLILTFIWQITSDTNISIPRILKDKVPVIILNQFNIWFGQKLLSRNFEELIWYDQTISSCA